VTDPLNTATARVAEAIRGLPEFAHARSRVVSAALAEIGSLPTVAHMRELGGYTAVVNRAIAALPSQYSLNCGSRLIPSTVADQLRLLNYAIASEVQHIVVACKTRVAP
jgi:hypothetical protein